MTTIARICFILTELNDAESFFRELTIPREWQELRANHIRMTAILMECSNIPYTGAMSVSAIIQCDDIQKTMISLYIDAHIIYSAITHEEYDLPKKLIEVINGIQTMQSKLRRLGHTLQFRCERIKDSCDSSARIYARQK